jgi:hypothetical protein
MIHEVIHVGCDVDGAEVWISLLVAVSGTWKADLEI